MEDQEFHFAEEPLWFTAVRTQSLTAMEMLAEMGILPRLEQPGQRSSNAYYDRAALLVLAVKKFQQADKSSEQGYQHATQRFVKTLECSRDIIPTQGPEAIQYILQFEISSCRSQREMLTMLFRQLVDFGANVNRPPFPWNVNVNLAPLDIAVCHSSIQQSAILVLLELGARPGKIDLLASPAYVNTMSFLNLDMIGMFVPDPAERGKIMLRIIAESRIRDSDALSVLRLTGIERLSARLEGRTALYHAAVTKKVETFKFLVERGLEQV